MSRERITKQQIREARTMAQVITEYERSLEEFGQRRRDEGQADILCRQVGMKFGTEAAEELRALLGVMSESGRISEAAIAVIECATPEEFLARVRRIAPA